MAFKLQYTLEAQQQLKELSKNKTQAKRYKAVKKSLYFLGENPAHPGLRTHKYQSLRGPAGSEVFEAYAENNTPVAYRIFWCYYPPKTNSITIIAITAHP